MKNRINAKRVWFILCLIVSLLLTQFAYAAFYDDSSRYIHVSTRATEDLHGESRSFYLDKYSVKVMSVTPSGAILDLDSIYVDTVYNPIGIGAFVFHTRYFYDKTNMHCWLAYMGVDTVDEGGEIIVDENGERYENYKFEMNGQAIEVLPGFPAGWTGNLAYQIAFNQRFW